MPQKTYNPMSLHDASALTPKIGLDKVISGLSSGKAVDRVIVTSPKYLKELQTILGGADPAIVQSYLIWKAVQAFYSYVDSPAVKPYKAFVNELAGKVRFSPMVGIKYDTPR